jgi:HAD superfamily hydrolase (TIGR01549 family)
MKETEDKHYVAVLFDLEDTLVQTPWSNHQHVAEFRRNTREKLIDLGIPFIVLEGIERATIMRNRASEYVERNFSKAKAERFKLEMEDFLALYEIDSAKKSRLFAETIPTLETLRRLGARTGLVTNTSQKAVDIVFRIHNLKSFFDVVVTRESVRRLKPDPEGILLAVKKLGIRRFFMVGDLVLDVLAAKSAKGGAILVRRDSEGSDFQDILKSLPAEILEKTHETTGTRGNLLADYVVRSLAEVPSLFKLTSKS